MLEPCLSIALIHIQYICPSASASLRTSGVAALLAPLSASFAVPLSHPWRQAGAERHWYQPTPRQGFAGAFVFLDVV